MIDIVDSENQYDYRTMTNINIGEQNFFNDLPEEEQDLIVGGLAFATSGSFVSENYFTGEGSASTYSVAVVEKDAELKEFLADASPFGSALLLQFK